MSADRSRLESRLTGIWSRRGPAACALLPLSLLFGLLARLRRGLFAAGLLRSERMPVPVVVVGNIFIGGTGKTPLTIWLVEALRRHGYTPGVISRGYGSAADAPVEVDAVTPPSAAGDEPVLIAQRTGAPVVVARRRADAARRLLQMHPGVDVIVSDDGLQHYALRRDVEIVLFDSRGTGNGWLLPAGPLREPASRHRDATVVNGEALPPGVAEPAWRMILAGGEAQRLASPDERLPLGAFAGGARGRIAAAAGIGNPARFFAMLRAAGLAFEALPLPDHFDFSGDPFAGIRADVILITEKDAVKCRLIESLNNDPRLWVVPVTARIDDALARRIVEKLRGYATA